MLANLLRIILLLVLGFAVLLVNSQLPEPLQLEVDGGFYGAVVLLVVLWFLVELLVSLIVRVVQRNK